MHVRHPTPELRARVPVWFYAFDLLLLDGRSLLRALRRAPGATRRARTTGRVQIPPSFSDVTGDQLLDIARQHGLEGVVAKRRASRYEPGRRSPAWLKTALSRRQEVLIGEVDGRRGSGVPALSARSARGVRRSGVRYLGHVGTGFSDAQLDQLMARLRPLTRPTSRSTRTCLASTPAMPAGPNPSSSARSSTR